MNWLAGIVIFGAFLNGVYHGWFKREDILFLPFGGFIVGLILYGLLRLFLRGRFSNGQQLVRIVLGACSFVSLYYFSLMAFAIYQGDYGARPIQTLAGLAVIPLVLGLALQRAAQSSN